MIPEKYIIKSCAKVNLHLEVLNKREDHYHDIFSLMAELELSDLLKLESFSLKGTRDRVSVEIINNGGLCSSVTDEVPAGKNLITVAVKNYMSQKGIGGDFRFGIEKNIPSGAGLGGGSSNAAAALIAVARALGNDIDDDMRRAASMTGSDVPFFLCGGFAFVEGRGDIVYSLDYEDPSFVLLVNNGIHIDTGVAYKNLNRATDITAECSERRKNIYGKIFTRSDWKMLFRNDFEKIIFGLYPELASLKEKMYNLNSFFSAMSGSGSTVFGLFEDRGEALFAQSELEKEGNNVYFTKFRSCNN